MSQGNSADEQDSEQTDALVRGHRANIERLFREHHKSLMNFLKKRLPSQEAREAAQEAFARLLNLDPVSIRNLSAFLYQSARNIAIDRHRRDAVEVRVRSDVQLILWSEKADILSPERQLSSEQTFHQILQAIEEMPPKCRLAFTLHQVEGMEIPQIAEQMHLSESMVRKYISKGLLHCRARLEAEAAYERR